MRFRAIILTAGLLRRVLAVHETRTFALLQFNGKEIVRGRIDPIVSPGRVSEHVHGVMGGRNFALDATGDSMALSMCTNAKAADDKSAYWFPWLYFHDPVTGVFEPVDIAYVNVYYFFEPTDDRITAFPQGLQIVSGNAATRTSPGTHGKLNLNPDDGEIQPVQWTCPRWQSTFEPPSWPPDSDGTAAGEVDPMNAEAGTSFPDVDCDGFASPLRADIHMPYCYDPSKGLDEYRSNMAQASQPFVLSNGDVTGYSSHADFLAAWDENVLQGVIDGCDAGFNGIHTCPGVTPSTLEDCKAAGNPLFTKL
ncbi:hypothetical protein HYQ44_002939 [Verticillium longisporum]|nr:hypothetical protein HYQ44_002939 [Verticillium longisporum]